MSFDLNATLFRGIWLLKNINFTPELQDSKEIMLILFSFM